MKTVEIKLTDNVYQDIMAEARARNRSAEEVLTEAIEWWRSRQSIPKTSILDIAPLDLGRMTPIDDEDILGEMLDDSRD